MLIDGKCESSESRKNESSKMLSDPETWCDAMQKCHARIEWMVRKTWKNTNRNPRARQIAKDSSIYIIYRLIILCENTWVGYLPGKIARNSGEIVGWDNIQSVEIDRIVCELDNHKRWWCEKSGYVHLQAFVCLLPKDLAESAEFSVIHMSYTHC